MPDHTYGESTKEYAVTLDRKNGGLAELTDQLGNSGVNIITLSMADGNGARTVRLITSDEKTCRDMLEKLKLRYTENEIVTVVVEDKPGSLAKLLKKLQRSNVEVNSTYMLNKRNGKVEIVLGLSDIEEGKNLLFRKLGLSSTIQAVKD
ncbi:MAG: hypothetical protein M1442_02870 [Candidatus Thermoplasmatota archaeon]|jgi:hypothetical protein|nr:hypothetical protein [Candidatus Thermoplasmatota archaeon]